MIGRGCPPGIVPPTGLVVTGGRVFDPVTGTFEVRDVSCQGDRVVSHLDRTDVADRVTADGRLVLPAFVDLHAHVFHGQDLGVHADEVGVRSGIAHFVDAGSAGAHLVGALRACVAENVVTRITPLLNISTIGTTSIRLRGELMDRAYWDRDAAMAALEEGEGWLRGVKVRASHDVAGSLAEDALRTGVAIAHEAGLPLMVHLGPTPASLEAVVRSLRPGDVVTHCFTGFQADDDGRRRGVDALRAARDDGVVLDVGHGASGFSVDVARRMIDAGVPPSTVSTDVHSYSQTTLGASPMAEVINRLLAAGLGLADALVGCTARAAAVFGVRAGGPLEDGAPADFTICRMDSAPWDFVDPFGNRATGRERLVVEQVIFGGSIVHDATEHDHDG